EVLDLRGDPDGEAARVERPDPVDSALAADRGAPGRRRVVTQRGDRAEAGDGDPSHPARPYAKPLPVPPDQVKKPRLAATTRSRVNAKKSPVLALQNDHGGEERDCRPVKLGQAAACLLSFPSVRLLPPRRGLPRAGPTATPQ